MSTCLRGYAVKQGYSEFGFNEELDTVQCFFSTARLS